MTAPTTAASPSGRAGTILPLQSGNPPAARRRNVSCGPAERRFILSAQANRPGDTRLDFLDEDPAATASHEVPPRPPRRRGRPPRPQRQQIMLRRAVAVAGGFLVLVLLILGVRGCLNARKERALKDYA